MADAQIGRLLAVLGLDDKQFQAQLKSSVRVARQIGDGMERVGRSFSKAFTAPLLLAATAATKFATDFDRTMTKIETLTSTSRREVMAWRKELLELGPALGQTPRELAEAMLVVTSTGKTGAEALQILTQSAKASAIGLGDTKDIARAVTAAVTAYGSANLSAAKATDILVSTVREGAAEANEMAGVLGRVLGLSAQLGVSFAEVGGFLATFTRLGVNAEEAVTALRGVLASILKPAKESSKALSEIGLSVEDLRKSIKERGLTQTLIDLVRIAEKTGGNIAAIVPNVRALAGVLGTAAAQASDFKDITAKIEGSTGTLDEAFERTQKSASFMFSQLKASVEATAISFAESGLLESALDLSKHLQTLVDKFRALDPETKRTILQVGLLVAAIGPLLLILGKVTTAVLSIASAFAALLVAIGPTGWLILGFAALGLALEGGTRGWSSWRKSVDDARIAAEQAGKTIDQLTHRAPSGFSPPDSAQQFEKDLRAFAERFPFSENIPEVGGLTAGIRALTEEEKKAAEAIAKVHKAMDDQINDLKVSIALGALDEKTRTQVAAVIEIQTAALKAGTVATREQEQAVFTLVGQLHDQTEAIKLQEQAVKAALAADAEVAQDRAREMERLAEEQSRLMFEPIRNAIESIQSSLADMFENLFDGGIKSAKSFAKSLLDIMKKTAAQIAAEMVVKVTLETASGAGGGNFLASLAQQALSTGSASSTQGAAPGILTQIGRRLGGVFTDTSISSDAGPVQPTVWSRLGEQIGGLSGMVGILAGAISGFALGTALRTKNIKNELVTEKLNPIYNLIGSGVGGIAGSIVGARFGGASGASLGGTVFGALGGFIGNLMSKQMQNESSFNRHRIGVLQIAFGGLWSLIERIFKKPKKAYITLATGAPEDSNAGFGPGGWQWDITGASPFGTVGLRNIGTRFVGVEQTQKIVDFVVDFDKQVAKLLNERQIAIASAAIQGQGFFDRGVVLDNEIADVISQRIRTALSSIFEPTAVSGYLSTLPQGIKGLDAYVTGVLEFLEARKAIMDEIDSLIEGPTVSEAAKALKDLATHFEDLRDAAEGLGFTTAELTRLEEARIAADVRLRAAFTEGVEDAILSLTDPFELATRELDRIQAERLQNAIDFGADLLRIEELNQLERARLLEEQNAPLRALYEELTTTVAGQLAPTELLANAEQRFADIVAVAQGGDTSKGVEVAEALRNLLAVSLQVFGATEQYFQRQAFGIATLQNLMQVPGFATGGGFTVPGSGRDNVVPLFRVSGGERVSVSTRSQHRSQEKSNAELRAAIEAGNAEREAGNRQQGRKLDSISEALDRQQSRLARMTALTARSGKR